MTPKLAILIPTIEGREPLMDRLMTELNNQRQTFPEVEILWCKDNQQETTGSKRNWLVNVAATEQYEYCAFFDDDDYPSPDYISRQMEVVRSGKDCGSLWGQIYFDCVPGLPFHHSIEFADLFTTKQKYCRPINHLNTCLTSIRLDHPFPNQVFGEDSVQALSMVGKIKSQHNIDTLVYHYFCGKEKGGAKELQIINSIYGR